MNACETYLIKNKWGLNMELEEKTPQSKLINRSIVKPSIGQEEKTPQNKLINRNPKIWEINGTKFAAVGDAHIGANTFLKEQFEKNIRSLINLRIPFVLMGDMVDLANRRSPGNSVFKQTEPEEQIKYLKKQLRPAAEEGLLIGYSKGNHEGRIDDAVGLNVVSMVCDDLGIYEAAPLQIVHVNTGTYLYSAILTHGKGTSSSIGTHVKNLIELGQYYPADIVLMAHCHHCLTFYLDYIRINNKGETYLQRRTYATTGHYLGYFGSYAEKNILMAGRSGSALFTCSITEKDVDVKYF